MTTKTKNETKEETQATEAAEQVATTVTLKVTGACRVKLKGETLQYGSEFEIPEADLQGKGIGHLFAQKVLVVKDNEAKTREVIENHRAGSKKDPNEGKTREELENGGDIK